MRSMPLLAPGQRDEDSRAVRTRCYLKCAVELLNALPHAADADPKRCRASDLLSLCGVHILTVVFYFQGHILSTAEQSDDYRGSPSVPHNIREALLHDSKQGSFSLYLYTR